MPRTPKPKSSAKVKSSAPAQAYAAAVGETGAMAAADAFADEARTRLGDRYRFENQRFIKKEKQLAAKEKKLFAGVYKEAFEDAAEFGGIEIHDVIETATGEVVYGLLLWPFGSGVLVDSATHEVCASFAQHGINAYFNHALREGLAAAYAEARTRISFGQQLDFRPGGDHEKPVAPTTMKTGDALARIQAFREQIKQNPDALSSKEDQDAIFALARDVLVLDYTKRYCPFPVRRVDELTVVERELFELMYDALDKRYLLYGWGFPNVEDRKSRREFGGCGELGRWLGRVHVSVLDETLFIDGLNHPIWCLVHDALHGIRPPESVCALLAASLSNAQRLDVLERLFFGDHPLYSTSWSNRLTQIVAQDFSEARRDIVPVKEQQAQLAARRAIVHGLFDGLDASSALAYANSLLAKCEPWISAQDPKLRSRVGPQHAYGVRDQLFEPLVAALRILTRHAVHNGVPVDKTVEQLLGFLGECERVSDWVVEIFALLPADQIEQYCLNLTLISRYPSPTTAATATRLLGDFFDGRAFVENMRPFTEKQFEQTFRALGAHAHDALTTLRVTHGEAVDRYLAATASKKKSTATTAKSKVKRTAKVS